MRLSSLAAFIILAVVAGCAGNNTSRSGGAVERLYVFNCGESTVADISRWTPGVNVGKPGAFSANCYLIRHAKGWMMWDSGINDNVATMPNGFQRGKLAPHYILRKPLRFACRRSVSIRRKSNMSRSRTHGDHVGNGNLFTGATLTCSRLNTISPLVPRPSK
jgi:hypothetical protein